MKNLKTINFTNEVIMPKNIEKEIRGKEYISWGIDNKYPAFLFDIYQECGEHQAIIDSAVNYVMGSGIISNNPNLILFSEKCNADNQSLSDVMRFSELDYQVFGGFALKIMTNKFKEVSEIYNIPFEQCRLNETEDIVYLSKKWGNWGVEAEEYKVYDPYKPVSNTIYYFKGNKTRGIYPIPLYNAGIKAIMTSIKIQDFHLNNIQNNFVASAIVNFNNGIPTEEDKEEIEREIENKFCGTAGNKLLVSFNDNAESAVTIERLDSDTYDEKYEQLRKATSESIFVSHKVTSPSLFGILAENQGFSKTEFQEAFQIYNKTVIEPLQVGLCNEYLKVLGLTYPNATLNLKPFVIEDITVIN